MSTPPFLDLPPATSAGRLSTPRGEFAVLDTAPAEGPARRGTVLLVPGFTGSKEDFLAILGPLSAQGHRVVAIDQRGQYQSDGPDREGAYAPEALADDLVAAIGALTGDAVHLVGHSFGGLVSRAATLAAPERVRSLSLLSSGPAAIPSPAADRLKLFIEGMTLFGQATVWEAMAAADAEVGAPPPADPTIAAFMRDRFMRTHPVCLSTIAKRLLDEPDRLAELAATGVPLLVAYGVDDDAWHPRLQAEMATRLRARHVVVENAGHSPAVDQPKTTAAALTQFWADVEAGTATSESA